MQKSEEDKIFTEYLRENGLIMGDSEPYLETYEPLRNTLDFQSYLLRRVFRKLCDAFCQSVSDIFRRTRRKVRAMNDKRRNKKKK